ncbi:diaminopimelate decarboxylase [Streptomyces sp. DconLS]|nr:diaminopimelate decarboxylase [Streptomyces sp. DconLS]
MTTVHELPTTTDALSVWPASTTEPRAGDLAVGGVPLAEAADRFGTPVYILDEAEVRDRCRTYRHAFPDAEVLYAAKAFLCRAMARWMEEEGLGLDVCSAGELELAVTTGFPPERIVLHGNAKTPATWRPRCAWASGASSSTAPRRSPGLPPPSGRTESRR